MLKVTKPKSTKKKSRLQISYMTLMGEILSF